MKRTAKELWKRLVSEAGRKTLVADHGEISRIAAHLRWKPSAACPPSWDEALWPLLLHFALPGAAALLLLAALLPAPKPTMRADNVDELIAATLPNS